MAGTLHRIFRRMFQQHLSFDSKEGILSCKRCNASCKLHEPLKCGIPSPLTIMDHTQLSFYTSPCPFDGVTYSEAKDIISERA